MPFKVLMIAGTIEQLKNIKNTVDNSREFIGSEIVGNKFLKVFMDCDTRLVSFIALQELAKKHNLAYTECR